MKAKKKYMSPLTSIDYSIKLKKKQNNNNSFVVVRQPNMSMGTVMPNNKIRCLP